jgi:SpoVK/Ycf46/Vps4 family AAA+-type ATPase
MPPKSGMEVVKEETKLHIHRHTKSWSQFFMELTISVVPLALTFYFLPKILEKVMGNDTEGGDASAKKSQLNKRLRKNNRPPVTHTTKWEDMIIADVVFPDELTTTFDDVGGRQDIKDAVNESVIMPLCSPHIFKTISGTGVHNTLLSAPKGVLFYGPPGTGKSMMAQAIAKDCDATFINVRLSTLLQKYFGESQKLVRALFSVAQRFAPSIIFIDEIDMFLSARGSGGDGGNSGAYSTIMSEFMTLWDGLTTGESAVTVLAATNRPAHIDKAIQRRLPLQFLFGLPVKEERRAILEVILKNQPLQATPPFEWDLLSEKTEHYCGSDLFALCKAAAMIPVQELLRDARERGEKPKQGKLRPLSTRDVVEAMKTIEPTGWQSFKYNAQWGSAQTRVTGPPRPKVKKVSSADANSESDTEKRNVLELD